MRKSKEPFGFAQDKPAGRRRYERRAWANLLRDCPFSQRAQHAVPLQKQRPWVGQRNEQSRTWRVVALEGGQGADGADYVFGLGQDCVFEFWLVGAEGISGSDAADGGVEIFE